MFIEVDADNDGLFRGQRADELVEAPRVERDGDAVAAVFEGRLDEGGNHEPEEF